MHELLGISAVPTEIVHDTSPQTCVVFGCCLPVMGATAALVGSTAQQAMDEGLLLHEFEVMLAFSYPMAKFVQGKEGIGPCAALASEACTAAGAVARPC